MTILCYHEVDPSWRSPLAVRPSTFAEHAGWLARSRDVVPLDDAVERLDRSGRLPRGTATLTFDDGFVGNYEHALPVLRRHGIPATVFLVARTLDGDRSPVDWVDTAPPWPLRTLTADQVLEMRDLGVRFGSHSYRHAVLPELTEAECESDLRDSREVLEDLLREPVLHLAYPRGAHSAHVRRAAERAGYRFAYSLPEQREPVGRFSIPRVGIYRGNGVRSLGVKTARPYLTLRLSPVYPMLRSALRRLPPAGAGG